MLPMNKTRVILVLIFVLAAISVSLAWILPVPPKLAAAADEFRAAFGVANFVNVLSIGTALLFLSGLAGFKRELKTAYYLICAGLLTQVVSTLIYSVLSYIEPVERNLIADLPITIGAFLMLLGVWQLARLLKVHSSFTNAWVILAYLLILSTILWLLPHHTTNLTDQFIHANHVLEALFYPLAVLLLWKASRTVSASYARSFVILIAAFVGNFVAATLFIGTAYLAYPQWASDELLGSLFIIDIFIYVAAGYSFSNLQRRLVRQQTASSTVDIVVFVASLASQPRNIDQFLDELRAITAKLPQNGQLSPAQEQQLTAVYRKLEDYLISQDPLRSFTRADIRELVQRRFDRLPSDITLSVAPTKQSQSVD